MDFKTAGAVLSVVNTGLITAAYFTLKSEVNVNSERNRKIGEIVNTIATESSKVQQLVAALQNIQMKMLKLEEKFEKQDKELKKLRAQKLRSQTPVRKVKFNKSETSDVKESNGVGQTTRRKASRSSHNEESDHEEVETESEEETDAAAERLKNRG